MRYTIAKQLIEFRDKPVRGGLLTLQHIREHSQEELRKACAALPHLSQHAHCKVTRDDAGDVTGVTYTHPITGKAARMALQELRRNLRENGEHARLVFRSKRNPALSYDYDIPVYRGQWPHHGTKLFYYWAVDRIKTYRRLLRQNSAN